MSDDRNADSLKKPPDGGKVRRPWDTLGMSRASWYRYGKPTKRPETRSLRSLAKHIRAALAGRSFRTHERIMRLDAETARLVIEGHIRPATAERLLLTRPIVIGSDGVARLPTMPNPLPPDDDE
jgi:hypothetical protein